MLESINAALETHAFSIFMLGWIVTLAGGAAHMIGGGFRDGASKVPVLGNWESLQPGDKGFLQQLVAAWIMRMGLIMAALGGFIHFF